VNLFWDKDGLAIRDLHRFDEKAVSLAHEAALKIPVLKCETLPIVEGSLWAAKGKDANAVLKKIGSNGDRALLEIEGDPTVVQSSPTELKIVQPLKGGGALTIVCAESLLSFSAIDAQQHPIRWGWELHGGTSQARAVTGSSDNRLQFNAGGFTYDLTLGEGAFKHTSDGLILMQSTDTGRLTLQLGE
jgi:hypothetical protein